MELLLVVIILILLFGGGFSLFRRSGSGHLMRPIPSGSTRSRPECENASSSRLRLLLSTPPEIRGWMCFGAAYVRPPLITGS